MRQRDKWVIVFAMMVLSFGPAACEGCNNVTVFVGDAEVIETDIVEQATETDNSQESGDISPEEPATDNPVEISEIDELEDEAIGCDTSTFEETAWSKVYATNDNTGAWQDYYVRETFDFSYIVAGNSDEFLDGTHAPWILKLDRCGDVIWERTYGTTGGYGPHIRSLALAQDLGYVVGGSYNLWMMKLGEGGNVSWYKRYHHEGQHEEYTTDITMIKEMQGGGFAACGTIFIRFVTTDPIGYYILRIDEDGQVIWSKQFDDHSALYSCSSLEQMPSGDLIVAGDAWTWGEDDYDVYVLRLSADGTVVWKKRYRRETDDEPVGLQLAPDGSYVLAVNSHPRGDFTGDVWFLKLDADGSIVLQETIGGEMDDRLLAMAAVGDDGYVLCGRTLSFGAGENDAWLVRLDSEGSILWQKSYGGAQPDDCRDIRPTTDGGFIVSGSTDSFGVNNLWVMKLDANGTISESCPPGIGVDTAAVVQETFAEAEDISITVLDWDLIVDDLDIVPAESASSIETQCAR